MIASLIEKKNMHEIMQNIPKISLFLSLKNILELHILLLN